MNFGRRATVVALLLAIWALAAWGSGSDTRLNDWTSRRVGVLLYFGNQDASGVSPEVRWFTSGPVDARARVEALIAGPRDPQLTPSLPQGTKLRSIARRGDVVTVDFSRSLVQNHPGGSAGETITVYSVVNTLTEIPGVTRVAWRIDGKAVETLVGHMDLSEPLTRNEEMIQPKGGLAEAQDRHKETGASVR